MFSGRRVALAATTCTFALAMGAVAQAETLPDAIALAYQTNPTLQAQRASQRALDETYVQALTGYRPRAPGQALLAAAQAQLAISRANYDAVVGQNPGDLAPEPPLATQLPPTVDQAFDVAEHDNPQLRQADYTEQGSAARVAEAKAQTRP